MKKSRPAILSSITMEMPTRCGKIYVTGTVDTKSLPFETFVGFGKAGHCGAAIFDATTKLLSYALRSGMDPLEAVKAWGGISYHSGTDRCMKAVALILKEVLEHPEGYTSLRRPPFERGKTPPPRKPPGTKPLTFSAPPSAGRSPQRPRVTGMGQSRQKETPFWPLYRPQPVSMIPSSFPPTLQLRRSPENRLPSQHRLPASRSGRPTAGKPQKRL